MSALSGGLYRPGIILVLALLVGSRFTHSAPVYDDDTTQIAEYEAGGAASGGCYYNFQHYREGDRILTNEPCLNCTCHNRMLMCYLRVCPFTKAIGQDCKVEKRPDQCCPVITCPQVPVQLLTSTTSSPESTSSSSSTELGFPDTYGCSVRDKFYADGAQLPLDSRNPCELCYCIRNRTTCVMQECTLRVAGCKPVYLPGVCCPVKYDCDYDDEPGTTVEPTPGLIMTTTTAPRIGSAPQCYHEGNYYNDGQLIYSTEPCNHCYCFHGDIACAVQDCGAPMQSHGKNCTALPPPEGECCPTTYECEDESETTTTESQQTIKPEGEQPEITTKLSDEPNDVPQTTQTSPPVNEESFPGADNAIPEIPELQTTIDADAEKSTTQSASESGSSTENPDDDLQQITDKVSPTDSGIAESSEKPEQQTEPGVTGSPSTDGAIVDETQQTDSPSLPKLPSKPVIDESELATTLNTETSSASAPTEADVVSETESAATESTEVKKDEQITEKPIVEDEATKPESEGTIDSNKTDETTKGEVDKTESAEPTSSIAPAVEQTNLPSEQMTESPEDKSSTTISIEQSTEARETGPIGGITTEAGPTEEHVTVSDKESSESSTIATEASSAVQPEITPSDVPISASTPEAEKETQAAILESETERIPTTDVTSAESTPAVPEHPAESSTGPSEASDKPEVTEKTTEIDEEPTPYVTPQQSIEKETLETEIPTEGPAGIDVTEHKPENTDDDKIATTETNVQMTVSSSDADHPELHTPESLVTETPHAAPTTDHPLPDATKQTSDEPEAIGIDDQKIEETEKPNSQHSTMTSVTAEDSPTLPSQTADDNNEVTESSINDGSSLAPQDQTSTVLPSEQDEQQHVQHVPSVESASPESTESSQSTIAHSIEEKPIDASTTQSSAEESSEDDVPTKGLTLQSSSEEVESSEESSSKAPTKKPDEESAENSSEEVVDAETEPIEVPITSQSPTEAVSGIADQSTMSAGSTVSLEDNEPVTESGLPIVTSIDAEKTTASSGEAETEEQQTSKPEHAEEPKQPEESMTQQTDVSEGPTEGPATAQTEQSTEKVPELHAESEEHVTVKEDSSTTDEEATQKPLEITAEPEEHSTVKEESSSTDDAASTSVAPSDEKLETSSVPTEISTSEDITTTRTSTIDDEAEIKPVTSESSTEVTANATGEDEEKKDETSKPSEETTTEKDTNEIPTKPIEDNETAVSDATTPSADVDASQQTEKIGATGESETTEITMIESKPTEQSVKEEAEVTKKSTETAAETTEKSIEEAPKPTDESAQKETEIPEQSTEKEADTTTELEVKPETTEQTPEKEADTTAESEVKPETTEQTPEKEADTTAELEVKPETTEKSTEKQFESTEKTPEQTETTEKSTEKESESTEKSVDQESVTTEKSVGQESVTTEKSADEVSVTTEKSIEKEAGESTEKSPSVETETTEKSAEIEPETTVKSIDKEAEPTEKSPADEIQTTEKTIQKEEEASPAIQTTESIQHPTEPTLAEEGQIPTEIAVKVEEEAKKPIDHEEPTTKASEQATSDQETTEKSSIDDKTEESATQAPMMETSVTDDLVKVEENAETATETMPKITELPVVTSEVSDTKTPSTTPESSVESNELPVSPIQEMSDEKTTKSTETPTIAEETPDVTTKLPSIEEKPEIAPETMEKSTEVPIVEGEMTSAATIEPATDKTVVNDAATEQSITESAGPARESIPVESEKPASESPAPAEEPAAITETNEISTPEEEVTKVPIAPVEIATGPAVTEETSTLADEKPITAGPEDNIPEETPMAAETEKTPVEENPIATETERTPSEQAPSVTEAQEIPIKDTAATLETKAPDATEASTETAVEAEKSTVSPAIPEDENKTEKPMEQVPLIEHPETPIAEQDHSTQTPDAFDDKRTENKAPGDEQQLNEKPFDVYGPPAEIPGEGSCLVDGQSYANNTSVPPANPCQIGCQCVSSIIQCELVKCSPPPSHLSNCMPVHNTAAGGSSCCPMYSCDSTPTVSLEADNQMKPEDHGETVPESTEAPKTSESPTIETKRPEEAVTEMEESNKTEPSLAVSPVTEETVKEVTVASQEPSIPTELAHPEATDVTSDASPSEATPEKEDETVPIEATSAAPVLPEQQIPEEIPTEQAPEVIKVDEETEKPADSTQQPSSNELPSEQDKPAVTESAIKTETEAADTAASSESAEAADEGTTSQKVVETESSTPVASSPTETEPAHEETPQDTELPTPDEEKTQKPEDTSSTSSPVVTADEATAAPTESIDKEHETTGTPIANEGKPAEEIPTETVTESSKPGDEQEATLSTVSSQEETTGSIEHSSSAAPTAENENLATTLAHDIVSSPEVTVVNRIDEESEVTTVKSQPTVESVEATSEKEESDASTQSSLQETSTTIASETFEASIATEKIPVDSVHPEEQTSQPGVEPIEEQKEEQPTTTQPQSTVVEKEEEPTPVSVSEIIPTTIKSEESPLETSSSAAPSSVEPSEQSPVDAEETPKEDEPTEEGVSQAPEEEKIEAHTDAAEQTTEKTESESPMKPVETEEPTTVIPKTEVTEEETAAPAVSVGLVTEAPASESTEAASVETPVDETPKEDDSNKATTAQDIGHEADESTPSTVDKAEETPETPAEQEPTAGPVEIEQTSSSVPESSTVAIDKHEPEVLPEEKPSVDLDGSAPSTEQAADISTTQSAHAETIADEIKEITSSDSQSGAQETTPAIKEPTTEQPLVEKPVEQPAELPQENVSVVPDVPAEEQQHEVENQEPVNEEKPSDEEIVAEAKPPQEETTQGSEPSEKDIIDQTKPSEEETIPSVEPSHEEPTEIKPSEESATTSKTPIVEPAEPTEENLSQHHENDSEFSSQSPIVPEVHEETEAQHTSRPDVDQEEIEGQQTLRPIGEPEEESTVTTGLSNDTAMETGTGPTASDDLEYPEPPVDAEENPHFPVNAGSYLNPDEDYDEEDQAVYGPGTCRYGGKVYVSAQQIPRDDPCDFCFCFRSDIICLQQSCPPPIPGCHEEPIRGFCCPRYECPVSMATSLNLTTTTTTTTTTLPPHFLSHAYKGAARQSGCQIRGQAYRVGQVIKSASGPCLHCTCGGDGNMKCDPRVCSPEPTLRQMIAAATARRRR